MAGVGRRGNFTIVAILFLINSVLTAPVTEEGISQALQLGDVSGDGRGCYYNFEHYDEGDRIVTNEPCLNCTCHNRMLMCYLRVCPFTKAIGQDCTVEKKPDQCCPIITCPQVPVALLTSSTTSETPPTTTALGRPDNYGCTLEDNTFYADGAQVPSNPLKPCELCYCIRNHTACVVQQCTLNVEGCRPVYQEGVCCPVRYECDYDEVLTTPKPLGLVTTPGGSSDCLHNGVVYHDGAMVMKDEKAPCEHCYCMRGDIVCAVQECGTPLEGRDCTPMEPSPGQCCPNYHCANGTGAPEVTSDLTSTETVPERVKDEVETEKNDSEESSNEADSSSEESNESVSGHLPAETAEASPGSNDGESPVHHEEISTEGPSAAEEVSATEASLPVTEISHHSGATEDAAQTPKPEDSPAVEEQPTDSYSEASQHQESEPQVPEEVAKDPERTNEVPESTPYEHSAGVATEETPIETARVPGEGSCLVEGKTYAHNTVIETANPCQEVCRCFSSIVSCKPRDCPPAPSADENCMPVATPGSCCPTYMCDQKTSDAPEVQDHKIDNFPHEDITESNEESQSTLKPSADLQSTEAPVVDSVPSDIAPPSQEHPAQPASEESLDTQSVEHTLTTEQPSENNQIAANENSNLNPNVVHGSDAALHAGQSEHMDSHENGNVPIPQPVSELSTDGPVSEDSVLVDQPSEEGFNTVTTYNTDGSISHTENSHTSDLNGETEKPHVSDLPALTEQDEGSGQEDNETPTDVEKVINELQDQIPSVTSEPGSQSHGESSTAASIVQGNEQVPTEASPQEQSEVIPSTSDEAKPEENGTEVPIAADVSSEENQHATEGNTFQTEQQTSNPESDNLPVVSQPDEGQTAGIEEENVPEVTTVAGHFPDTPLVTQSEELENSHKQETSPAETPLEGSSDSVAEENVEHSPDTTVVTPVENQPVDSTQVPSVQEENGEASHDPLSSTDAPATILPVEPENAATSQPDVMESTAQPVAEDIHHDSVPESSQHNVETSEDAPTEVVEEHQYEEPAQHEGTETQDKVSGDVSEVSTSAPQAEEVSETSEPASHDEESANVPEKDEQAKEGELVEKHPEESPQVDTEEKKPEEISTSHPLVSEDKPPSSTEAPVPAQTQEASHDEYSTIIYEEVKVSGMPSIESHVTEGTSDLHQPSSSPAPDTHAVTEGEHIPGPEGIPVEQEVEKSDVPEKQETLDGVLPNTPSDPVSVTSEEKPVVVEPELKPEEDTIPEKSHEEAPPQDTNEADSVVSETVQHGTASPEITNEINGEKEQFNQIPSDDTVHLVDDNHHEQNEVSNELIPGGIPTTHTEQPAQPPAQVEPDLSSTEASEEIPHSEDSNAETTNAPAVSAEESTSPPEGSHPEPVADPTDNDNNEQTLDEAISSDHPEEQPSQNSEESHSDVATTVIPTPEDVPSGTEAPSSGVEGVTSDNVSSETLHEETASEETSLNKHEEEKPQDEISESESTTQVAHEGSSDPEPAGTDDESAQINESAPATDKPEETLDQENQGSVHELSTEKPEEVAPETASEDHQISETSGEKGPEDEVKTPVSDDQNAIVGDVTHVESNVPQVPDSANQLLETPENVEETSNTILPDQESGDGTHPVIEEKPSNEENIVSHEEAVPSGDDQTGQLTDSENQSQQEIGGENQEVQTASPESQTENQEVQGASEHQENPSQPQEISPETEHETPSTEEHETSSEKQEVVSDLHETDQEGQEVPPSHEETVSDNQETASEHQETASEHQDTVPEHEETGAEQQVTDSVHEEIATAHEEPIQQQESTSAPETETEHHEAKPEDHGSSSESPTPGNEQLEAIPEHHDAEQDQTVPEHEPPTQEHEELPEHPEIVTEGQITENEGHEIATEGHEAVTETHEAVVEDHEAVVDDHQVVTEGHEAVTEGHEPVAEVHEVVTEGHEAVTERHEPVAEVHEVVTEGHEAVSEGHEAVAEVHEVVTEGHETVTEGHEPVAEVHEVVTEEHEAVTEGHDVVSEDHEVVTEGHEAVSEGHEAVSEGHEPVAEVHEVVTEGHEAVSEGHETVSEGHEAVSEGHEAVAEIHEVVTEGHEALSEGHEVVTEGHEAVAGDHETVTERLEEVAEHHETTPVPEETNAEHQEPTAEQNETVPEHEHQEVIPEQQEPVSEHQQVLVSESPVTEVTLENNPEQNVVPQHIQESGHEQQETASEHIDTVSEHEIHTPTTQAPVIDKEISTTAPHIEMSSEVSVSDEHGSTEGKPHTEEETSPVHSDIDTQKHEVPTTLAPQSEITSQGPQVTDVQKPGQTSEPIQSIVHSTETGNLSEVPSSTQRPIVEEPNPMFPSWSQKPFDHHTTPEPHTPEESPYPTGFDPEYEDEEGASYGPGTCRYGGKVYLSAQQIPRDDPCDFCFCFRSDIICLQQSCPPPIRGCYQETIKGFCCPRYECHVSMATMLNMTTTTTTTTTTLPPHFFAHAYNGAATKAGCQVKGVAYHVGERIPSTSGPCLECRCGANGQMKCDPTVCGPQEALLRQVMDAAVSRRRR